MFLVISHFNLFTTFAGTPATTTSSSTFFVTTAPAATTTLLPIVTPGNIIAPPPIHTSSPIVIDGCAHSVFLLSIALMGCVAANICTFGPSLTLLPIVTFAQSVIVQLKLAKKLRPMCILNP